MPAPIELTNEYEGGLTLRSTKFGYTVTHNGVIISSVTEDKAVDPGTNMSRAQQFTINTFGALPKQRRLKMLPVVRVIGYTTFLGVPPDLLPSSEVSGSAGPAQLIISKKQDMGSNGARLIECAGRNCYDSYGVGRPSSDYHNHIKDVGHGCYDAKTEVLTAEGWKLWPKVRSTDKFATRTQSGKLEYHLSSRLIGYMHEGSMVQLSGGLDLLVTPDHKLLAAKTTTLKGRRSPHFALTPAESLVGVSHRAIKTADWQDGAEIPKHVAALLGFAIGDGSITARSAQVKFNLRRERKIAWLRELCDCGGFAFREAAGGRYSVDIPDGYLELFRSMYGTDKEKQIPGGVLLGWDRESLFSLYAGLIESDGSVGNTGTSFDTTSKVLADQFVQLCLHVGVAANVCYRYGAPRRTGSYGRKALIRLMVVTRCLRPEVNKHANAGTLLTTIPEWSGMVYCAEVPNNTLYVRRNGRTVWSGNSVCEHVSINFYLDNISRGLSHELVRHRAGCAISQRSTRYVDEHESTWVLHPLLTEFMDTTDAGIMFGDVGKVMKTARDAYKEVVEALEGWMVMKGTDKFTARKQARGAARGLLGNALCTSMVWTANVRALRTVIEQRASRHADAEIRVLANRLWEEAMVVCPEYFNDYERTICPDGIGYELTTKYRKI